MGNCHATGGVVGVAIEHPDGRVERLYWGLSARQLMLQYPGNYVALVPTPPPNQQSPLGVRANKLKLLPPDAMLSVGQRYRLVSFEDVLREISGQKQAGRSNSTHSVSKSKRVYSEQSAQFSADDDDMSNSTRTDGQRHPAFRDSASGNFGGLGALRSISFSKTGQWRPALQSISELGR